MNFEDLLGKKIEKCYINQSKNLMAWIIDDQVYQLEAIGECCSLFWYEHCENASVLQGFKLLEVDAKYIRVNILEFKTNKGNCTIKLRNEFGESYAGWILIKKIDESSTLENYIEKYLKNDKYYNPYASKEYWNSLEDF